MPYLGSTSWCAEGAAGLVRLGWRRLILRRELRIARVVVVVVTEQLQVVASALPLPLRRML